MLYPITWSSLRKFDRLTCKPAPFQYRGFGESGHRYPSVEKLPPSWWYPSSVLCALVRLVCRRDNCCFLMLVTKFWLFLEGLTPGRVRIEKYLNNFIRSSIKISKEHMFVDCIYLSFTKVNFTPITIWFHSHQRSWIFLIVEQSPLVLE